MSDTTATEEISLYDVWRLLVTTAARLDRLYTALAVVKEPLLTKSPTLSPTMHVSEHPFFGILRDASVSVPETMANLRGDRYAAL